MPEWKYKAKATGRIRLDSPPYQTLLGMAPHNWFADEPPEIGGNDTGPEPFELLLGSLAACTCITVRMYAERKGWPLVEMDVSLRLGSDLGVTQIEREITFHGELTDEQRTRLMEIADRCPVHKVLSNPIQISSKLL